MEFKVGRFDDISLKEYHHMPGWSKSALDLVNQSMAHYLHNLENPKEQTEAMAFGSALHCKVLTPELFDKEFYVWQKLPRNTKEGKAAWAKAVCEAGGRSIIDYEQLARIEAVSNAVLSHPVASQLLCDGSAEQSFMWIDKRTGLQCKARPDYFRNDKICLDLKTTEDASYFEFQRKITNYRYHVQGSFFADGITESIGELCNTFILIAVETSAPYNVAIYRLDDDALSVGRGSYQRNLDTVKEFFESEDKWPGYPVHIQDMILPPWTK